MTYDYDVTVISSRLLLRTGSLTASFKGSLRPSGGCVSCPMIQPGRYKARAHWYPNNIPEKWYIPLDSPWYGTYLPGFKKYKALTVGPLNGDFGGFVPMRDGNSKHENKPVADGVAIHRGFGPGTTGAIGCLTIGGGPEEWARFAESFDFGDRVIVDVVN